MEIKFIKNDKERANILMYLNRNFIKKYYVVIIWRSIYSKNSYYLSKILFKATPPPFLLSHLGLYMELKSNSSKEEVVTLSNK